MKYLILIVYVFTTYTCISQNIQTTLTKYLLLNNQVIEKVENARFPKDQQKTPDANQQAWTGATTTNKTSRLLVKIGSLAAILIILLIIYLSLLQHV